MARIVHAAMALGSACALLVACGRRAPSSTGPVESDLRAQDSLRAGEMLATARSAAAFHSDLSRLDWITGLMAAASDSAPEGLFPHGFGEPLSAPQASASEPSLLTAFLKAGADRPRRLGPAPHGRALAKAAAPEDPPDPYNESDSSWFDYRDSAQGRVHWMHVFRDPDFSVPAQVRDSLVYRWPNFDSVPVMISSSTVLRRFQGGEYHLDLTDEDGDGTLNGSVSGGPVLIRKEWRAIFGDTTRESVWHLERLAETRAGQDDGEPRSFSDTVFASGRALSWSVTVDADGDGYALLAKTGGEVRTAVETGTLAPDGTVRRTRVVSGAGTGTDSGTAAAAGNPWYAFARSEVGPAGDTVESLTAGDADGDGRVFDPLAEENKAWEVRRIAAAPGRAGYRDSVVRILSKDGEDRIAGAWARTAWPDGSISNARAWAESGSDFALDGGLRIRETRIWPKAARPGDADSLVREARMDNNHFSWSESKTWRAPGGAVASSIETRTGGNLVYSAVLPDGRTAAGRYDAGTRRFDDTLVSRAGNSVLSGTLMRDGSAEYGVDGARTVRVDRVGAGFIIAVTGAGTSLRYDQGGDTTRWTEARGGLIHFHTAAADGEGGYALGVKAVDRDGLPRLEGSFRFLPDGTGSGRLRAGGDGDETAFSIGLDGLPVAQAP